MTVFQAKNKRSKLWTSVIATMGERTLPTNVGCRMNPLKDQIIPQNDLTLLGITLSSNRILHSTSITLNNLRYRIINNRILRISIRTNILITRIHFQLNIRCLKIRISKTICVLHNIRNSVHKESDLWIRPQTVKVILKRRAAMPRG